MRDFTENSYNLTTGGNSYCVKPGSIYTNPTANFHYFNNSCGDPYTYYSYWYRRFPDQTKYLNCYYLPRRDVFFRNKWGYKNPGKNCAPPPNLHFNSYQHGFKFYDTKINAPTPRINLSV